MRARITFCNRRKLRRASKVSAARATAIGLAAAAILSVSAAPAMAQGVQCGERDAIVEGLASKHDERPISMAVTNTGSLLEVLASPSGSWTIIISEPGGATCLVSAGEGWRGAPAQVAEKPAI